MIYVQEGWEIHASSSFITLRGSYHSMASYFQSVLVELGDTKYGGRSSCREVDPNMLDVLHKERNDQSFENTKRNTEYVKAFFLRELYRLVMSNLKASIVLDMSSNSSILSLHKHHTKQTRIIFHNVSNHPFSHHP